MRPAGGLAIALVSIALAGCDTERYTVREERRFDVSGTPEVRLVTFDGPVEVRPWDRPEVLVEIVKTGRSRAAVEAIEVVSDNTDGIVRVEARRGTGTDPLFGQFRSLGARLIASVPPQANVTVRSGDGAITIERVSGRLELRTGDGAIHGLDLRGDIAAYTSDGAVRLKAVEGRVDLSTGDGAVSVDGTLRRTRVRTRDGSITVRAEPGSVMSEPWDLATGDGGVALYVPPDFNGELDAETDDGVIRTEIGIEIAGGSELASRRRIRGRLGAGGPVLRIRTGDGSIAIRSSGSPVSSAAAPAAGPR